MRRKFEGGAKIISFSAPQVIIDFLNKTPNKSDYICKLIFQNMGVDVDLETKLKQKKSELEEINSRRNAIENEIKEIETIKARNDTAKATINTNRGRILDLFKLRIENDADMRYDDEHNLVWLDSMNGGVSRAGFDSSKSALEWLKGKIR